MILEFCFMRVCGFEPFSTCGYGTPREGGYHMGIKLKLYKFRLYTN